LKLQRELKATVLYVTHDQTEALTMGDRVAVLHAGKLQQVAPPQEIYDHPANRFVAGFIGSPAMNFITARITRRENQLWLDLGGQTLPLPMDYLERRPGLKTYGEKEVLFGIRPEHFTVPHAGQCTALMVLKVKVDVVETLGPVNYVHFWLPGLLSGHERVVFVASLNPAIPATPGQVLELVIEPHRLHFFDPDIGKAL
jgi:multiple sugar transport system ATP-binding protein